MQVSQDLTLREVTERLAKSGSRLHLNFEHGVYHAYVHGPSKISAYKRGDLAEVIDEATKQTA